MPLASDHETFCEYLYWARLKMGMSYIYVRSGFTCRASADYIIIIRLMCLDKRNMVIRFTAAFLYSKNNTKSLERRWLKIYRVLIENRRNLKTIIFKVFIPFQCWMVHSDHIRNIFSQLRRSSKWTPRFSILSRNEYPYLCWRRSIYFRK